MRTQRRSLLAPVCLLASSVVTLGLQSGSARVRSSTRPQMPRPGDKVKEVAIGAPAPGWSLKTAEGGTVVLSELRGKVVVLDFWANWCGLAESWSRYLTNSEVSE